MNPPNAGLDAIENASIDEIRALQLQRLKQSLRHSYNNSPVYRQKFERHGIHPDDMKSLEDLGKFPFTSKADLRDNYPFGMFAVPMEQVVRLHASSGTTGKPTVVGYTRKDIDTWAQVVARSIHAAGGRPCDKVHVAYGYGMFTGGLGAHYGAERLGCAVIPLSGGQTARQVQLLRDFNPDIIMVTPSYMLNIADEIDRQGLDAEKLALRLGIFGAEPWTGAMGRELERRLRIDALDIYGLAEIIGPGVAQECLETKDGPTIWEDHFYPEIIDPKSGAPLPDGKEGELVFTSLTREAMPLIRYRTRDLTRLLPGSARSMRRINKITGRSDDMLIIRGVNVFPTQIEEQILSIDALAPHYLIKVDRQGNMDRVCIQVETKQSGIDGERLGRLLADRVKAFVGIRAKIQLERPGALPRSEGKARRVLDYRR